MSKDSSYTVEKADAFCELLSTDMSERAICAMSDMPDRRTLGRWREEHPEFAAKCARAREAQADYLADEMAEIEGKTLRGEVEAAAARCVLSSKQWRASKLSPKRYGDRTILAGDAEAPLHGLTDEQVDAKLAALLAKNEGK